jgi:choice-of-anchor B domain-containing protein
MDGTSFVDVTDAESPRVVANLPNTEGSNAATWRDMKVYENHVFVVADGAGQHGVQVYDLRQLRDLDASDGPVTVEETALYTNVASVHNIVINEETGFAYAVGSGQGGETCGGGLHMIDIRTPAEPTFAGCFADPSTGRQKTGYSHDAQCVVYNGPDQDYQGREICLGANETALSIADVTDKDNPVAISMATYPNVGYTHQGWFDEEQRYFYMNDELDEMQGLVERTRTLVWDLADLDDPVLVKEHLGTQPSIDHNLYIKDELMYQSNYMSGLRILDISDRENPVEVAFFDTVPYGDNSPSFGGSWSNYPYFASGTIVVTSGSEGLFVLKKQEGRPVS